MKSAFLRDLRGIPNLVSLLRIVLVSIAIPLILADWHRLGLLFGVLAGVTDYFDGILARRLGQVTYLGAILDLFSDLVFETAAIMVLIFTEGGPSPLLLYAYLLREFWVTTIRRFMASHQLEIMSSILGKAKSNFLGWGFMFYFAAQVHLLPTRSSSTSAAWGSTGG